MQQFRQRVLVMDIGWRDHSAVRQAALAVHPNMQLHAEMVSRPRDLPPYSIFNSEVQL
jgi:hypothetical protein